VKSKVVSKFYLDVGGLVKYKRMILTALDGASLNSLSVAWVSFGGAHA
jgi:hypothetical protein